MTAKAVQSSDYVITTGLRRRQPVLPRQEVPRLESGRPAGSGVEVVRPINESPNGVDGLDVSPDAPAKAFKATQRAVASLLLTEPVLLPEAARRLVTALDPDAPDLGERLAELAVLVADRPALAVATAESLRHYGNGRREAPEHALAAARRLAADDGLAPGLFAVALTTTGAQLGWPTAWRDVLHTLRRHPRPDVRDAALAVVTDPA